VIRPASPNGRPSPPRVSIGVPVYNGERYLPRALDSLLGQDFEALEVVVSDNASTDGTREICCEYARRDPRLRYHRNDANIGLFPNFNRAFALAGGEYFKWAAHDDWWEPGYVSRCVQALDADPGAVLCTTGVRIVDGSGETTGAWRPLADLAGPDPAVRFHRLLWTLGEPHAVYGLARTAALRRTSMLQSLLGADRVLLAELSLLGGIVQLPEPLHVYTVDLGVRRGRRYSTVNDPRNRGQLPLRTWRLARCHLQVVGRSSLPAGRRALLAADVLARFGVRDARRMLAEAYHSGRILLQGHRPASSAAAEASPESDRRESAGDADPRPMRAAEAGR
jgi:glycosyltransferase involved in cell wall biosynthesis